MNDLLAAFETHDDLAIKAYFEKGLDPNLIFEGKPLIYKLIDMYTRGADFAKCMAAFVESGLDFEEKPLLAVLLNDAKELESLILANPKILDTTYSLQCTFTPLRNASLMHTSVEYNHVDCLKILIKHGANVNAKAGIDENGFGAQTPIFHAVNQNRNFNLESLEILLENHADLDVTVKGLIWGETYEWETYIPEINLFGYAMMGLLPQFQRTEADIYKILECLNSKKYGKAYVPPNIPNKYLA
jgi:ankyrin repeat protein